MRSRRRRCCCWRRRPWTPTAISSWFGTASRLRSRRRWCCCRRRNIRTPAATIPCDDQQCKDMTPGGSTSSNRGSSCSGAAVQGHEKLGCILILRSQGMYATICSVFLSKKYYEMYFGYLGNNSGCWQ